MPTRKEFCRCCLAAILAGLGAPLFAGRKEEEVKKATEKRMIAKCGLVCSECPAYVATRKNDDALRAKTAGEWSAMFHADIQAADINCDGCQSEGPRLFHHCFECGIRKCALEKKVATCAACAEYACAQLREFFAVAPQARETLEGLRAK